MSHHNHILAAGLALTAASLAPAQPLYHFAPVTDLALAAVAGTNVPSPVPGFDLLLMKDGRVVYHQAFGDWSLNRTASADSATKTISGMVIMSVVDSNATATTPFTLNAQLSDFIPAFTGPAATITIRQAFAHTSGLPNSNALSNPLITLQQAAAQIATLTPLFTPGTRFLYGGTSMHAAGAAAEVAAGQPWNQLFAERFATPLNLTATRYVLSGPQNPRIAGGCESNATEFARLMEVIRRGGLAPSGARLLSTAAAGQIVTRQTLSSIPIVQSPLQNPTNTDAADYGVGMWLNTRDTDGNLIAANAAGARGFSAWIDFPSGVVGVLATDTTSSSEIQSLIRALASAAATAVRTPRCYANCDDSPGSPSLTPADFTCFLNAYRAGTTTFAPPGNAASLNPAILAYANCDNSTTIPSLTPADFTCFLAKYRAGCQ